MFAQLGYYICVPFAWLTRLFYTWTGSYGVALILFTLIVKLVLLPFQLKSKKSMLRMGRMNSKVQEIQKKYANNKERQQQEIADLYAREGVNPMSGCLWSFLPFPILIALYYIIRTPLRYFMSLSNEVIAKITELAVSLGYVSGASGQASAYDQIYLAKFIHDNWSSFEGKFDGLIDLNYNFLSMDLSAVPKDLFSQFPSGGWPVIGIMLMPLISAALQFLMTRISMKTNGNSNMNGSSKAMLYMMPLMTVWMGYILPAALCVYWIANAAFSYIQEQVLNKHVDTLFTLASVRHTIDTRDKFYDEEMEFANSAMPQIQQWQDSWTAAMLASPYRKDFAEEYGDLMFVNAEIERKAFSPDIMEELQQENELTQQYGKLLASAQIPFEGGVYTLSQLSPFKNDPDDARRLAAWKAEGQWYKDNQKQLDDIYDKLTHLRDKMGKKLGYEGYTTLGYYRMGRNCYTKADVEKFRAAVVKYLVPLADSIYREQAKRLGKQYPMSFADNALMFRSGNPAPCGDADAILAQGKKFYEELSPETGVFFNTMLDNELLDVLSTPGKAAGGYCTSLWDYQVPFIFANFNGTQHDVEVVTHEAGHAFAAYTNRDRVPYSTVWPSMEGCEVHSMSMEFFAWPWAEGFFGKDTRKFLYSHLAGALTFFPYGTMVDHFQHIVYEKPDLTPAERHAAWKELLGIYMPWMKLDGEIPFYSEGEGWQRQKHIYESPFYYIDYCLAQTVSLQFWAMLQKDRANAWEHYMAFTRQGGSRVFTELLKNAGLDSPFEESCLRGVCETAKQWLDSYDLTGIE